MKDLVLDVELMKPLDRIAGASLLKVFIYSFGYGPNARPPNTRLPGLGRILYRFNFKRDRIL